MSAARLTLPHLLPPPEVGTAVPAVSFGGLPLGVRHPGEPVLLPVLRPQPATIAVLAGRAVTLLLAGRAADVGARVVVCSEEPGWRSLALATGTERNPAEAATPAEAAALAGSHARPLVTVTPDSCWDAVAARRRRPWVTSIAALSRADLRTMAVARGADVVLVGGVPRPQLPLVRSTLRLPDDVVETLPAQPWTQLLAVGGGTYTHVDLAPSRAERERCAPQRDSPPLDVPEPRARRTRCPEPAAPASFEAVAGLGRSARARPAVRDPRPLRHHRRRT